MYSFNIEKFIVEKDLVFLFLVLCLMFGVWCGSVVFGWPIS